ncbi:DUF4112 domain-containing protein [Yoonia sp. 208BN28-4]|uniref:DUF4112 domain-containing protein n=1 Tax=Yoonia sp. 208BN28-4 TaxID=3126505 RepID=UPI00309FAB37
MQNPETIDRDLEKLGRLSQRMDALFRIPGTSITVGLDSILGLVPVVGDVASLTPAAYMVWRARQLGARNSTLTRMAVNSGLDFAIGSIPILGDIFDTFYKANLRNYRLMENDLRGQIAENGAAIEKPPHPIGHGGSIS